MSTRLFRWVGSKHHLVPRLAPLLREQLVFGGGRIVSLFYGSGALEQAAALTEPQLAAEANPELRCLYEQLVHRPSQVHAALISLDASVSRNRAAFLRVRALDAEALSPLDRAVRFLWLSAMSFNGLWRVNRQGRHNVPPDPGRLRSPWPFPTNKALREAARRLWQVTFVRDWCEAAQGARPGDLVLSDPPYLGGFDAYTAQRFPLSEQLALADALAALVRRCCTVVAFNSPAAKQLYAGWASFEEAERSGRISCMGSRRQPVRELIALAGLRSPLSEVA